MNVDPELVSSPVREQASHQMHNNVVSYAGLSYRQQGLGDAFTAHTGDGQRPSTMQGFTGANELSSGLSAHANDLQATMHSLQEPVPRNIYPTPSQHAQQHSGPQTFLSFAGLQSNVRECNN